MSISGVALPTGEDYSQWRAGLSASWTRPTAETHWAERMYDEGTIPFVHLMIDDTMENIDDGVWHSQLAVWLYALKRYQDTGRRMVVVLFPEMNGNWTPYGQEWPVDHNAFIRVFRSIVDWGRSIGLNYEHIQWCFAPNDKGWPLDKLEAWYPGDSWVDVIGGSVYNWGGIVPGKPWQWPKTIIDPFVREIRTFTNKLIVITQTGSGLNDFRSPLWLDYLASMDVPFIYFNISEFKYGPGRDNWNWRIDNARALSIRPDYWFDSCSCDYC